MSLWTRGTRFAIDPLTRVLNGRSVGDCIAAGVASSSREGLEIAILVVDVDNLRSVNSQFGQYTGDCVLRMVAARIQRSLGARDRLGRHRSDEFVILAPASNAVGAARLAERIRAAIDELDIVTGNREFHITISIGAASLAELAPSQDDTGGLLALANARMNVAKALGGNRICATSIVLHRRIPLLGADPRKGEEAAHPGRDPG